MSTLTSESKQRIRSYTELSIGNTKVRTPYINNRRIGLRGALAVLVGKGTPEEIEEEALILALKEHVDLATLTPEQATSFLVDHQLGVDCSGYAFHILNTELESRHHKQLKHTLSLPLIRNPFKRFFAKLQLVKHAGVRTLTHEKNSHHVELEHINAGDMIAALEINNDPARHHVLIVTDVVDDVGTKEIRYTHSFAWTTDGKYTHGVRGGVIRVKDFSLPLLAQVWEENGKVGDENETYREYALAKNIGIYRLNVL